MANEELTGGQTAEEPKTAQGEPAASFYNPGGDQNSPEPNTREPINQSISWTASEFVHHHKSRGWFIKFGLGIAAISVAAFFIADVISAVFIAIIGVLFGIVASKTPDKQSFQVDESGISIGRKFYPYGYFKSFAILQEGEVGTINLLPLKRFMPEISIYYPPDQEARIVEVLSANLPNDQRVEQSFDRLMKKIRF